MRVRWKFRRSARLLRLELLLWTGGVVCLGVYGYYWLERTRVQSHYRGVIELPVRAPQSAASEPFVGLIEIPRLKMSAAVLEGVDEGTLRNAVGHMPGSAVPGRNGRVTLAAHRDTFFRPLQHIRLDDRIRLKTASEEHEYEVAAIEIVSPDRVDVISATNKPRLTLVTCYPFSFIGRAPQRFIVHADPVAVPAAEPPRPTKTAEASPPIPKTPRIARRVKTPQPVVEIQPVAETQAPAGAMEETQAMVPPKAGRNKVLRVVSAPIRKAIGWVR